MINNLTTLDRLRQRITRDNTGNVTIETLDGVTPVHTLTLTNSPTGPTPNEVYLIANSILTGLATGAGLSLEQSSHPDITGVVASTASGELIGPDGETITSLAQIAGTKLATFGDSRMANAYVQFTPTAISLSGQVATIQSTGLGVYAVDQEILLTRNNGIAYMRATIASVVDANNITATVIYPKSGIPTGSVLGADSNVIINTAQPVNSCGYQTWLLELLGQPFSSVKNYSYNGARVDSVTQYQLPDALSDGFDTAWVYVSANDWLTTGDNSAASVVISKLENLIRQLAGKNVYFFLEAPLSGGYLNATNTERLRAVNAYLQSSKYIKTIDVYTIVGGGAAVALPNMLVDGLHPAQLAAKTVGVGKFDKLGIAINPYKTVSSMDAGSLRFPIANPTLSGTIGANLPTGYYQGTTGSTAISSISLAQKSDGTGNQFTANITSPDTATGSYYVQTANTSVTAGKKYRAKAKIKVSNGIGVDFIYCQLLNATGSAFIGNLHFFRSNVGIGSGDGTYTLWCENDIIIPAGVTSAFIRARIHMEAVGSAQFTISDIQLELKD